MRLSGVIGELLSPTRCAGCEMPGSLLCDACDDALPRIDTRRSCTACGAPYGLLVCTECWRTVYAFESVVALGVLDGPLSRAIVLHKDAGERRLGPALGGLLGNLVCREFRGWADVVTWIPPTRAAVRRRGFDHGRALALPVGEAMGVCCRPLLSRDHARDQRALGRSARSHNARGSLTVVGEVPDRVLIVDDVLTTGATLDAAAAVLRDAGASQVRGAVLARAW